MYLHNYVIKYTLFYYLGSCSASFISFNNLLYIFIGLDITVIGIINNFASLFIYLKIFFLIDIILQIKNIILKIIFIIYIIGNLFIN